MKTKVDLEKAKTEMINTLKKNKFSVSIYEQDAPQYEEPGK